MVGLPNVWLMAAVSSGEPLCCLVDSINAASVSNTIRAANKEFSFAVSASPYSTVASKLRGKISISTASFG